MLKQKRILLIAVSLIIAATGGLFAWKPLLQAPLAGGGEKLAGNTAEAWRQVRRRSGRPPGR